MSEGRVTIKKGWERAGIAGIVENMTDFPDEDLTFAIHFVLSDNDNVRSILSDFVLAINKIVFFFLIFGKSINLLVAKTCPEKNPSIIYN